MIHLAIINQDGKEMSPQDLTTATDLLKVVEQARMLIRDCERLARDKSPRATTPGSGQVPYGG